MALAKPQLRGLLKSRLKTHFVLGLLFCSTTTGSFYFGVRKPRERKYKEFYRNLDTQKEFVRLRDAGVFHSVRPGGKVGSGW
ncbi:hypothetical protein NP493_342g01020 [Ridgeia piscesae]|uniref:Mitochondrial cytochrome c oxidase subunit VIc/VIIs domain-containing protein n=1 Tax=Ridgeia piscesae TaxID=27915 RepID=A0AAD9L3Z9_RIDPI|nr:hypothetical protein NP493_342g01020 [Ridgeia piscesae]